MSNNDFFTFERKVSSFLSTRGIENSVDSDKVVRNFHESFMETLFYNSSKYNIPYEKTLEDMANPKNLIDNKILHTTFRKTFEELISLVLMENPVFKKLLKSSLQHSSRAVGVGELMLPLCINDYRYSNTSDGIWGTGYMSEVKNGGPSGASLKTNGDASMRHGDDINKKYFNGKAFGYKNSKKFNEHLYEVGDKPDIYFDYFKEFYPNIDTRSLAKKVRDNYKNKKELEMIMGEFAISTYKFIDKFYNLIIISPEKSTIVNICDTTDVRSLGLKFTPKMIRGGDTNALADGYVNVKIG